MLRGEAYEAQLMQILKFPTIFMPIFFCHTAMSHKVNMSIKVSFLSFTGVLEIIHSILSKDTRPIESPRSHQGIKNPGFEQQFY